MLPPRVLIVWSLTALYGLADAGVPSPYEAIGRPLPTEAYGPDAHLALRHAALDFRVQKRDQDQADIGLGDDSADGVASTQVTVICQTCYIAGLVAAELRIDGDVDFTQLVNQTIEEITGGIANITDSFWNQTKAWGEHEGTEFALGQWDELTLPTYNQTSLELPNLRSLPNTTLIFGFGGVELFLELKTSPSKLKYQLPIVSKILMPDTGFQIGGQSLGIFFSIDLIVTVNAQVDITSGIHMKVGDGAALHVDLFGTNVSEIIFNGGTFEFLPITVETSAGNELSAILRVGLHTGFSEDIWSTLPKALDWVLPKFGGGVDAGAFVDIAEFVLEMTETPDDPSCELQVAQEYSCAIGASAGASVEFSIYIRAHRYDCYAHLLENAGIRMCFSPRDVDDACSHFISNACQAAR
ncbi:hypothetical protein LTR95_011116 [Oleoguttula sp. CCFEE 5521]